MTDTSGLQARTHQPALVLAGTLALAAVASIVLNTGIALLAGLVLPDGGVRMGLQPIEYAPLTVAGILLGTLGWYVIRRTARKPRAVLRVLVPLAVLLSFGPDLGILAAGASFVNSLALMAMHVIVAVITVPVLARVLPLPADPA
ncbi:hypothetical protein JOF56_008501 [Kibdelosporangium banguiense]|uniref:PEP-CTERM protein-sorting domain-containing protein n=1 Tax=Kibdelosporangium banguiense TaxID=1365924 RepID=A0ABS4TUM9_9PSEU|nr:DUF6069 family protein [Kibdelosporangium banguiense]MBP2328116.1 hypothetical protein [Kibdelosporangium banguiense]